MNKKALSVSIFSFILLLSSCLRPSESNDARSDLKNGMAKPRPGASATLTKKTEDPLYNLEYVSSVLDPASKQPVSVALRDDLTVSGWAVDGQAHKGAAGVDVTIDGKPYAADYDLPRGDVVDHFRVQDYANAGFSFKIPARAFGAGRHKITIRILANDKSAYYEGLPVTVDIR